MSGKNKIFPMKFQWCQGFSLALTGSPSFHIKTINFYLNTMKLSLYLIIIIYSIQVINGQVSLDKISIFGYKMFDYDTDIKRDTVMCF